MATAVLLSSSPPPGAHTTWDDIDDIDGMLRTRRPAIAPILRSDPQTSIVLPGIPFGFQPASSLCDLLPVDTHKRKIEHEDTPLASISNEEAPAKRHKSQSPDPNIAQGQAQANQVIAVEDSPASKVYTTTKTARKPVQKRKAATESPVVIEPAPTVLQPRKPAKSSRTITKIALAHVTSRESPPKEETSLAAALLDRGAQTSEPNEGAGKKAKRKPRKSTKKPPPPPPRLLSPEAAASRVQRQNLLFGTSSQLASGDSPRQVRHFQQALEASAGMSIVQNRTSPNSKALSSLCVRRQLWTAAARDSNDKIIDLDPFPASSSPPPPPPPPPAAVIEEAKQEECVNDSFIDIDLAIASAPAPLTTSTPQIKKQLKMPVNSQKRHLLSFGHLGSSEQRMPLSSLATNPKIQPDQIPSFSATIDSIPLEQPLLSMDSPAKVPKRARKSAKATGDQLEKPKRPRGRPKKDASTAMQSSTPKIVQAIANAAPKRRGRPPKAKPAEVTKAVDLASAVHEDEFVPIDDIIDSEPESPSTPRKRGKAAATRELDLSPGPDTFAPKSAVKSAKKTASKKTRKTDEEIEEERLQKLQRTVDTQMRLNPFITQAIRSAPPTKDLKRPSWHEKILLYDPIVIEHLTEWLKGGPLQAAGWDIEAEDIEPFQVQRWCEANSICCLWEGGLRGGVRLAY